MTRKKTEDLPVRAQAFLAKRKKLRAKHRVDMQDIAAKTNAQIVKFVRATALQKDKSGEEFLNEILQILEDETRTIQTFVAAYNVEMCKPAKAKTESKTKKSTAQKSQKASSKREEK